MAGYSQLNRGYDEQPGIDWAKIGLYGAGAAAGYGVIRAGMIKGKPYAKKGYKEAKAALGMDVEKGMEGFATMSANQSRNANIARAKAAITSPWSPFAGKPHKDYKALADDLRKASTAIPDYAEWSRADQVTEAAKGFFGAMDYSKAAGGAGGWKQFGVGAARVGAGLGAVGLGMKALSFLNPFGD